MQKVEYNRNSYNQCLCGGCPVNRASDCSARQHDKVDYQAIESEGAMPDPKILGGIYCATGKSPCDDLPGNKACLCPACSVELQDELPGSYYCRLGNAEEMARL